MSLQHVQQFTRSISLIAPQCAHEIASLANAPERNDERSMAAGHECMGAFHSGTDKGKPFPFAGGVAVIPMWGALLHRDRWCDSYATGYSYIESRFAAALGDEDVKGIMFDVNSYGGHVAGNFELCDLIYAARGKKPMLALVDSRAMSGGYSLASAVGRIIATPSSDVGSVGVVMMHTSYEKMLEQAGIETSFIFAGKHKVDGNPYEDLPDDVRAALQASVSKSYEKFVSLVARNRGIDPEAVRNTEARVYDAEAAKSLGLIDDVMAPRDAFASFLTEVSTASTLSQEVKTMSKQNEGGSDAPDTNAVRAESATAERQRVAGIINSEDAKGREALASHFAFNTSMSVEDAVAALAAAPKAEEKKAEVPAAPAPGANALAAAMNATGGGANVAPDGGDGEEEKKAAGGGLLKVASNLGYVQANKSH